jgi:hypothetical protein
MAAANRLGQISGHLSATHAKGLLLGEVAIITGASVACMPCSQSSHYMQALARYADLSLPYARA